jgi:hypothetical protein
MRAFTTIDSEEGKGGGETRGAQQKRSRELSELGKKARELDERGKKPRELADSGKKTKGAS